MLALSWMIRQPPDETRAQLVQQAAALACEHFQLCAAAGCACVTGQGEQLCHEWDGGSQYPFHYSEGPTWSVMVTSLDNSVRIDLHLKSPLIGHEFNNFTQELYRHGLPVFSLPGSLVNQF